jgi:protein gp37
MKNTKIEWAHHTVNFWWGCTKVSEACAHCYAESLDNRRKYGGVTHWGPNAPRWLRTEKGIRELFALNESARKRGVRERVFINSMSDFFEVHPDLEMARVRPLTAMEGCEHLDILLLTKRPENVLPLIPSPWEKHWPAHISIGTTVENQKVADARIPQVLKIPARVRFLSCEPLLGKTIISKFLFHDAGCPYEHNDISSFCSCSCARSRWVICGGESGHGARPMHPEWARSLRYQCQAAGVPFFFKQWGDWIPLSEIVTQGGDVYSYHRQKQHLWPNDGKVSWLVGKKLAGRVLDGVTWDEVPS